MRCRPNAGSFGGTSTIRQVAPLALERDSCKAIGSAIHRFEITQWSAADAARVVIRPDERGWLDVDVLTFTWLYITISLLNLLAMHTQASDRLDATFLALADPTRRAILARLARGEASVTELAEPFAISQPAISKHLKMLERAGLVTVGQDAQRRPRPGPGS